MPIFVGTYVSGIDVGISNYIKTLFTCYRLNKHILNNNLNYCVDSNFLHLFNVIFTNVDYISPYNITCHVSFEEIDNFLNSNEVIGICGWRLYVSKSDNVDIDCYQNEWYLRDIKSAIDFRYLNIPNNIKNDYLNVLNKFTIQPSILEHVNNFKKIYLNDEYTSVHIRTWFNRNTFSDNRTAYDRYNHYLSVRDEFVNYINLSPHNKILICTDNITEIQYIIDKINKNKTIILTSTDKNLSDIQNDFSDILLLGGCKYLIGSLNSTFTELAWWYSGCINNIRIL